MEQEGKKKRGRPSIYAHLSVEERLDHKMEAQRRAARAYYQRHKVKRDDKVKEH